MKTLGMVSAVLLLLVGTTFADPFTGRYKIESLQGSEGENVSGYIDFVNAPMGTTTFNLGSAFVSGFSIVGFSPRFGNVTYDNIADAATDDAIVFDVALGAPMLIPVVTPGVTRSWLAIGNLDGEGDGDDYILLRAGGTLDTTSWSVGVDNQSLSVTKTAFTDPPAWKLTLVSSVPEPCTTVLAFAAAGLVAWRRRRRQA